MNCPQCEQPVAADHFHIGEWTDEFDTRGRVSGCYRRITIHCEHCGYFTAEQDGRQFIRRVTHHASPTEINRVARKLPTRTLEKVPA